MICIPKWRLAGRFDIYKYCMMIRNLGQVQEKHHITQRPKLLLYKRCNHFWASLWQAHCSKAESAQILQLCF